MTDNSLKYKSAAAKNRALRQDAFRELLSNQKHHEHIVRLLDKIMDENQEVTDKMLARYKITIDAKLALLKKYIPDLKATELTGEGGGDLQITWKS